MEKTLYCTPDRPLKSSFKKNIQGIIRDFDRLPIHEKMEKPRVGIVGEILVKFSPSANNYLVDLLEAEGAEAVMPDLLDFFLYCFFNTNFKRDYLGKSKKSALLGNLGIKFLETIRKTARKELRASRHFSEQAYLRIWQTMHPLLSLWAIKPVKDGF